MNIRKLNNIFLTNHYKYQFYRGPRFFNDINASSKLEDRGNTFFSISLISHMKFILCILILVFSTSISHGQQSTRLPDILPPSPTAFSITRYGGISIGLQTGTPQINIPIYNIKSRKLSLPISINYSSNGIKVDELGSRVGMSWTLDAGGVITRTVYDDPDESSTKLADPNNFNRDQALYQYLETVTGSSESSFDTSPDIFSFNFSGYSGQFIINSNEAIQLSKTALRIEVNQGASGQIPGKFRITTPEGNQYIFGGSENSVESSSNSVIGENCGKTYSTPIDNAWYLTKIIHADGDIIDFLYDALIPYTYPVGISQTKTRWVDGALPNCASGAIYVGDSNCENLITTNSIILKKISFGNSYHLDFKYIGRPDLPYDYLLERIEVYDEVGLGEPSKMFSFSYQNFGAYDSFANQYSQNNPTLNTRPFLMGLNESVPGKLEKHKHLFEYINASSLPPRLSYSQDHFGYFNGAMNAGLIPRPDNQLHVPAFADAGANRTPSFSSAQAGMLSKIYYPTGGTESISYTSPIYTVAEIDSTEKKIYVSTVGTGFSGAVTQRSPEFTATHEMISNLQTSWQYRGDRNDEDYHAQSIISILDLTNNRTIHSELVNSENISQSVLVQLYKGIRYAVECTSYGEYSAGSGSLTYFEKSNEPVIKNKESGGVVIDYVQTYDPSSDVNGFKKYYYSKLKDVYSPKKESSGIIGLTPVYMSNYQILKDCGIPDREGHITSCGNLFNMKSMHSNSLANLYGAFQHNIYFETVIEGLGADFENGGVEHRFNIEPNLPGKVLIGNNILSSPFSNTGVGRNGLEIYKHVFQKAGTTFISKSEILTHYRTDDRLNEVFFGYTPRKRYDAICFLSPPSDLQFNAYDLMKNDINSRWVYIDTVETRYFGSDPDNKLITKVTYNYDSPYHLQITGSTSNDSQGIIKRKIIRYPHDMVSMGYDPSGVYTGMINSNFVALPIETIDFTNNNQNYLLRKNYINNNGNYLPNSIDTKSGYNDLERRSDYKYDSKSNIVFSLIEKSKKSVYIYSYNFQYPIAEIRNADYATVEAILGSTTVADIAAANPTDSEITSWINQLRNSTSLKDAHITSYTYKPLVGMTSMTDPKGMTTYYEYDEFQRLKNMKDQNGNILKNTTYHYKN
ncbi:hypothetical protein [Pedobacter sp. AJM]|uniref:hypothetical protein n=1 Tax=Pedobacter sp. AJM TaxID=2003629 RepID=UPI000B4A8628|nr:hypothetical protein [Pedobacter sp. AJM]OWK68708.1 hypothetical protein CBW18_20725 [Pedobacter sp. AJM]